jgi:hypothetical protein
VGEDLGGSLPGDSIQGGMIMYIVMLIDRGTIMYIVMFIDRGMIYVYCMLIATVNGQRSFPCIHVDAMS